MRTLCGTILAAAVFLRFACLGGDVQHVKHPEVSGVYPHLAMFNDEGECGTGAVGGTHAPMDVVGDPTYVVVVQNPPGYNSWPMIQAVGSRLVCVYSRGSAHTIDEGVRGV